MRKIIATLMTTALLLLSACARDLSSNTYTSDSTFNLTLQGKVLSVRPVTIKNSDELSGNTGGLLAGGALGGALGSTVGGGSGKTLAMVGGAIAGALGGAAAQGKLSENQGLEYIVKVDTSKLNETSYYGASAAQRSAVSSAVTSGLVTVVQAKDSPLVAGQQVYVIYSGDRTRVISAN